MGFSDTVVIIFSNTPGDVPTPEELSKQGRIGINQADSVLFTKGPNNTVVATKLANMDFSPGSIDSAMRTWEQQLPTSDAGLPVGSWWSNGGMPCRVKVAS